MELSATHQRQYAAAVHATARLLIASLEAGWRMHELLPALGIKRAAAEQRVTRALERGVDGAGIMVPMAPARPPSRPALLRVPAAEREWLTLGEAAELAGVNRSTISRWRRAGLLPHTWWIVPTRPLYLRADVLRVVRSSTAR